MAWRIRVARIETDGALIPEPWNEGHAHLAEEVNGNLDRDNLPENCITVGRVANNTFSRIQSDQYRSTSTYDPNTWTTGWQHTDDSGDTLGLKSITSDYDCVFLVEFSCEHWFDWVGSEAGGTAGDDCIKYRITVDGTTISESGWYNSLHEYNATWLVGMLPVGPGVHTIRAECKIAKVTWDPDDEGTDAFVEEVLSGRWDTGYIKVLARCLVIEERKR